MNRRYQSLKRKSKIVDAILYHIEKNLREYVIVSIIFLIGIIIGVLFINKTNNNQKEEITTYISTFITDLKESKSINEMALFLDSAKKNISLAFLLWFMVSTVIGIFIVYIIIGFKGFCLGYTISSITLTLGRRKRNFIFTFFSFFTKYYTNTIDFNAHS